MWIPYDLSGSLKAETSVSTIEQSKADQSERDVMVGFFVRNPVTLTWELDIAAGTLDGVTTATVEGMEAVIAFYGNDAGKLDEIIYRVASRDPFAALAACRRDLEDRLARWTLQLGRGMAIAGWCLADPAHEARWRSLPVRPSALQLDLDDVSFVPSDMKPFFRLYQRARNASDSAWRLINAFAVLKRWRDGEAPFPRHAQETTTVTLEMLVHSGAMTCVPELKGQPLRALVDQLEILRDATLSELGSPGSGTSEAAAISLQERLSPMASLADFAARDVLLLEIARRRASEMALAS